MTKSTKMKGMVDVKSPAEKILEILNDIKKAAKSKTLRKDLEWAIEMISTNKLYDPILTDPDNKERSEVNQWLKSYTNNNMGSPLKK
jgi:hypothetical protein